ncbi:hypothetical protein [Tengunoibacter tsumagoiensis]|uniref:Uncharacterized protein n=1 Tax=Tengunoibacter tsumagoiensis TaxID=2014871 RepID=A0A402A7N6_9CHLR|nr:hypothetical protein [Tengunoibacter tsumagoiensis]GCE15079.1 hypothetical protein KTT_49380 [Tengunoibacter tsumagoiensis]
MAQTACGCTQQRPSPTCEPGKKLFIRAVEVLPGKDGRTSTPEDDERWEVYTHAYLAYHDHVRGWSEGDVKVQRGMGEWMISLRSYGRWIFHFGTQDASFIYEWLQVKGYQQFVGQGEQARDRLSGFYRKHTKPSLLLREPIARGGEQPAKLAEQERAPGVSSHIDLKTLVTILIALLVAHIAHTPTVVERLLVQRRAANLLRVHGIHVGLSDEQVIQELIEEVVRQNERIRGAPLHHPQELLV